ncbi:hypothetical protein KR044_011286 [Drosophila immigrans]|nr:hypothetical protein KR044_011286 [Drosophila immigrans]
MRHTFRLIFLSCCLVILLPTLCHTRKSAATHIHYTLYILYGYIFAEHSCQTPGPEKTEGQCVHFSSCRFVLRQYAMYKEHMPPNIMRFLQRSRCRPKVDGYHLCCELKDVIPANANSKLK